MDLKDGKVGSGNWPLMDMGHCILLSDIVTCIYRRFQHGIYDCFWVDSLSSKKKKRKSFKLGSPPL